MSGAALGCGWAHGGLHEGEQSPRDLAPLRAGDAASRTPHARAVRFGAGGTSCASILDTAVWLYWYGCDADGPVGADGGWSAPHPEPHSLRSIAHAHSAHEPSLALWEPFPHPSPLCPQRSHRKQGQLVVSTMVSCSCIRGVRTPDAHGPHPAPCAAERAARGWGLGVGRPRGRESHRHPHSLLETEMRLCGSSRFGFRRGTQSTVQYTLV